MMIIPPYYFDVVGFPMFIILFIVGWRMRKENKFGSIYCILLSVLGLLADGYSLITNFIL